MRTARDAVDNLHPEDICYKCQLLIVSTREISGEELCIHDWHGAKFGRGYIISRCDDHQKGQPVQSRFVVVAITKDDPDDHTEYHIETYSREIDEIRLLPTLAEDIERDLLVDIRTADGKDWQIDTHNEYLRRELALFLRMGNARILYDY